MSSFTPFADIEISAPDPILSITESFRADRNPNKVNLSLGAYYDGTGSIPLLDCVRRAETMIMRSQVSWAYLPIEGLPDFIELVAPLLFGAQSPIVRQNRAVTIQTVGSSGALKLGADFLGSVVPKAQVWISNPSWANHRAIFEGAGFQVDGYPYYDHAIKDAQFAALLDRFSTMRSGDVVVLHGCCHNPTGMDLSSEQWASVAEVVRSRRLIPFMDFAYQGLAEGLEADRAAIERLVQVDGPLLVANSFSKSLSLYGERVGGLTVVASDQEETQRIRGQLKKVVRITYSSPPTHGARLAATVLGDPELRLLWERELAEMRARIQDMRSQFVQRLTQLVPGRDFGFILHQRGLFSYSHLPESTLRALQQDFSIYTVASGRICIAALNPQNIDYVTAAIASTIK